VDLVIVADDGGMSSGIDAGIREAVEAGAVTAVSVLAHGQTTAVLLAWLRDRPDVGVGVHLAVGPAAGERGTPLGAAWSPRATRALQVSFEAQRRRVEDGLGRSIDHVDSHQHIHLLPWIRPAAEAVARCAGVRLRRPWEAGAAPSVRARAMRLAAGGGPGPVGFVGFDPVPSGDVSALDARLRWLAARGVGQVEWMVHPGRISPDHPSWDGLRAPREAELAGLLHLATDWPAGWRRCRALPSGGG